MTCIVGYVNKGTVWLAGDSLGSDFYNYQIQTEAKVFKKAQMVFGSTGDMRAPQLLQYALSIPRHNSNVSDMAYLTTTFTDAVIDCFKTRAAMSDHLAELSLWKALAQDKVWDDFVAPCSCYVDAYRNNTDVPEKEIRPKLLFTTPGDYPILVCEYCGHDVIGETIEKCVAKHNADMYEYDLAAWGTSIWEGRPAYYPLTEQMVLFGFKMATRGEKPGAAPGQEDKAPDDPLKTQAKEWRPSDYVSEARAERIEKLAKHLLGDIKPPPVIDGVGINKKPDGEAGMILTPEQQKEKEAKHFAAFSPWNDTIEQHAQQAYTGNTTCQLDVPETFDVPEEESKDVDWVFGYKKLSRIVRALLSHDQIVLRTEQSVIVMYREQGQVYTVVGSVKFKDSGNCTVLDARQPWAFSIEPYYAKRKRKDGFKTKLVTPSKDNHAVLCCVSPQDGGDDVFQWHNVVDMQPYTTNQMIPATPTLAEIVTHTAEPPQKEKSNA